LEPGTAAPIEAGGSWLWIALAGALLAIGAALFAWRRRALADEAPDEHLKTATYQPPEPALPESVLPPPARPMPEPEPEPEPVGPQSTANTAPIEVTLDAQSLTSSLVYANLAYRLSLTNHGEEPVGPLRIAGDMIAAHTSLSTGDQLSFDGETAAAIHRTESLAPGETAVLSGQLRLAMNGIKPIRQGPAALFVPLARFHIAHESGDKTPITRIFVVGEANDTPGGALKPFPMDRMPGAFRTLDQRDVSPAA
jgi:hypothetical protein